LSVCVCVCVCVCMYVYMCVNVAICLGSREAQLPQLSTLALALKSDGPLLPVFPWTPCSQAHCSLGPRTKEMIYCPQRERERERTPLSPLSSLLPFISFHSLNHACQPYYFFALSERKTTSSIFSFQHTEGSPFLTGIVPLISVAYPPFYQLQLENTKTVVS